MTRHALTALATAAAYVIGWKSASAWWGRCASECRRGASNGAGAVSVDPRAVSDRENGAGRLPRLFQINPWASYAAELDAELMTSNPDLYFAQARERARRFVRRTA